MIMTKVMIPMILQRTFSVDFCQDFIDLWAFRHFFNDLSIIESGRSIEVRYINTAENGFSLSIKMRIIFSEGCEYKNSF